MVCVLAQWRAVQKWLNHLWASLGCRLVWSKGTMY